MVGRIEEEEGEDLVAEELVGVEALLADAGRPVAGLAVVGGGVGGAEDGSAVGEAGEGGEAERADVDGVGVTELVEDGVGVAAIGGVEEVEGDGGGIGGHESLRGCGWDACT